MRLTVDNIVHHSVTSDQWCWLTSVAAAAAAAVLGRRYAVLCRILCKQNNCIHLHFSTGVNSAPKTCRTSYRIQTAFCIYTEWRTT